MRSLLLLSALFLPIVACGLPGQEVWSPGLFPLKGIEGDVLAVAVHDSGNGPVVYAGGSFSLAGRLGVSNLACWTGSSWEDVGGGSDAPVRDLRVFDDGAGAALYAAGDFTQIGGVMASGVARWDGSHWSSVGSGLAAATCLEVFDDGSGPALMAGNATGVWRFDGSSWALTGAVGSVSILKACDLGGGERLYAGGNLGAPFSGIASFDGSSWSPLGSGVSTPAATVPAQVTSLEKYQDAVGSALYVGGNFTFAGFIWSPVVARWDGASWSAVGGTLPAAMYTTPVARCMLRFSNPGFSALLVGVNGSLWSWDGGAWTLRVDAQGAGAVLRDLATGGTPWWPEALVAGSFARLDQESAAGIGRFDGFSIRGLGRGLDGDVRALVAWDDGHGLRRGSLFAAGEFTSANGQALGGIARWNTNSWTGVGGGVDGTVRSLTIWTAGSRTLLVAGGDFGNAGGAPAAGVAAFDGQAWSPLGSGVTTSGQPGMVHDLLAFDTGSGVAQSVYACGSFTMAGGTPASGVARWNGNSWSPVGAGLPTPCEALAGYVDAGGLSLFAVTGGSVQRFQYGSWNPLPPSGLMSVKDITAFDDGGGPVLVAAGTPMFQGPPVVRFTGAGWVAMDQGFPPYLNGVRTVHSLGVIPGSAGDVLLAGGRFTGHLARWNGTAWQVLSGGLGQPGDPGRVTARAFSSLDDGRGPALFVGGHFSRAGGVPSASVARHGPALPAVDLSQPLGAAAPLVLGNRDLLPGRETWNLFSFDPCPGGPGAGPWLGLCFNDPALLMTQVLLPSGVQPFHFTAPAPTLFLGSYLLPPVVLEAVCVELASGTLGAVSPVAHLRVR